MGTRHSILPPLLRLLAFCAIAAVIFAPLLGEHRNNGVRYDLASRDGAGQLRR